MPGESRVQRWRANKREQGLKQVRVWLTPEDELRLKDIALQWHCSPSQVLQRALAQLAVSPAEHRSPPDTLQIRRLILAELEALGIALPTGIAHATVGATGGPPDTQRPDPAPVRQAGRQRSELGTRLLALLQEHPEGLTAEQLRGMLTPDKPLGDMLAGMRRLGTVRAAKEGRGWRYFAVAHVPTA